MTEFSHPDPSDSKTPVGPPDIERLAHDGGFDAELAKQLLAVDDSLAEGIGLKNGEFVVKLQGSEGGPAQDELGWKLGAVVEDLDADGSKREIAVIVKYADDGKVGYRGVPLEDLKSWQSEQASAPNRLRSTFATQIEQLEAGEGVEYVAPVEGFENGSDLRKDTIVAAVGDPEAVRAILEGDADRETKNTLIGLFEEKKSRIVKDKLIDSWKSEVGGILDGELTEAAKQINTDLSKVVNACYPIIDNLRTISTLIGNSDAMGVITENVNYIKHILDTEVGDLGDGRFKSLEVDGALITLAKEIGEKFNGIEDQTIKDDSVDIDPFDPDLNEAVREDLDAVNGEVNLLLEKYNGEGESATNTVGIYRTESERSIKAMTSAGNEYDKAKIVLTSLRTNFGAFAESVWSGRIDRESANNLAAALTNANMFKEAMDSSKNYVGEVQTFKRKTDAIK